MKDHRGNERLDGYRIEDYQECEHCRPLKDPDPKCTLCGGYGDYPKNSNADSASGSLENT